MDSFLALLIALLAFAVLILLISRSVKFIMLFGIAFLALIALRQLGIVSW